MTRINVGIKPSDLSPKHLIAEHRELKRIPSLISKGKFRLDGIPLKFTLGKGHVKFFYNKLAYLKKRYEDLFTECRARGYNVTYYGSNWDGCPAELFGDWQPSHEDTEIIKQRIQEKQNAALQKKSAARKN